MAFAPVYDCPNCGDVWQVEIVEFCCGDGDYIQEACCRKCGKIGLREKLHEENGERVPIWHALTEEEIRDEMWSDPSAEPEYDPYDPE